MSDSSKRSTNWGEITVLATGLNSEEKIKSAVVDLAAERFQIEIKGNPDFSNATTGYVFGREGDLERWVYVGRMEPLDSDKVQILTIGPGGSSEINEEDYYESDEETGEIPRDERGKPTSELLSVHDVIDDTEAWMADAVSAAIEAWRRWNS